MKNLNPVYLLCLFLTLCGFPYLGNGQASESWTKGYYEDLKGNKVEGYYKVSGKRYEYISFKKSLASNKAVDYTAKEVRKISNDKDEQFFSYFKMMRGEPQTFFIKKLIEGPYSLYRGYEEVGLEYYLASRPASDSIRLIPAKATQPFLEVFFKESCAKVNWTKWTLLTYGGVGRLVVAANECTDEEMEIYESVPKEKIRNPNIRSGFHLSSSLGFSSEELAKRQDFSIGLKYSFTWKKRWTVGVGLGVNNYKSTLGEKLLTTFDYEYFKESNSTVVESQQIYRYSGEEEFEVRSAYFELSGRYYPLHFKKMKLQPFVEVGSRLMVNFYKDITVTHNPYEIEYVIGPDTYPKELSFFAEKSRDLSYDHNTILGYVGLGVQVEIGKNKCLHLGYKINSKQKSTVNYDFFALSNRVVGAGGTTTLSNTVAAEYDRQVGMAMVEFGFYF